MERIIRLGSELIIFIFLLTGLNACVQTKGKQEVESDDPVEEELPPPVSLRNTG